MFLWNLIWRKGPNAFPACVQAYWSLCYRWSLTLLSDGLDFYNWSDNENKGCSFSIWEKLKMTPHSRMNPTSHLNIICWLYLLQGYLGLESVTFLYPSGLKWAPLYGQKQSPSISKTHMSARWFFHPPWIIYEQGLLPTVLHNWCMVKHTFYALNTIKNVQCIHMHTYFQCANPKTGKRWKEPCARVYPAVQSIASKFGVCYLVFNPYGAGG